MDVRIAALVGVFGMTAAQTLPHPNVVTGTVTGDGKPVIGAVVTLVARGQHLGQPYFHVVNVKGYTKSDEHGAYRLENLPLGDYYVVAIPHNPILTPDRRINRSGYRITYYPSAKAAADAMPVTINIHAPAIANIKLLAAKLSVVSGTVIGENGRPVQEGVLSIAHGDNLYGIDLMGLRIRPDGSFLLPLAPGTYFLQHHEGAWPPPRGEVPLVSHEKIVVTEQDIAGVRVGPIHQVPVSGRVVLVDGDRAQFQPSQFEITVAPTPSDGNPGPTDGTRLRDDLSFTFKAWPQPSAMRVIPYQIGWRVSRVTRDGVDITGKPFDVTERRPITGVVIELERAGSKD